jgi:methionyl-tRNA synthetase
VLRQLNLFSEENLSFSDEKGEIVKVKTPWDFLPAGHKIGRPTPLFEELVHLAFRIFLSFGHNFTPHNLQWLQKDENVSEHRKKCARSQAKRSSQEVVDAEAMKISNQLISTTLSGNCLDTLIYSASTQI